MWFVKSKRAQTSDDDETWVAGGVAPTLNAFDMGDTRATVIIFEATRVDDVRIYPNYSPTVATYWGTGGARVPYVFPIQGTVIGRSDEAGPQGKGYGEDGEVMFTLDRVSGHAIAYSFDSLASNSMKSNNPNSGCREVDKSKTLDTAALNPNANQGGMAIIFSHNQGLDPQASEEASPTLRSGGNGMAVAFPLDLRNATRDADKLDEQNRQGLGVGNEGDPSPTITNAFVPGVVAVDTYNQTLSSTNQTLRKGNAGIDHTGGVIESSVVRRLTPTECERLQGFPDGWTDGQADSHRYKQMGNAVAVPVVQWIIDRLVK